MSGPWYRDGLRFTCARCGNCCTGAGTVRVTDAEIAALAEHLELADAEFRALYTRRLRGGEVSLREKRNEDCVFYDRERGGCSVYESRPRQCRTWPFWNGVVHSRERWNEEAECCPGMNGGALHDEAEIARHLADDGTSTAPALPQTGSESGSVRPGTGGLAWPASGKRSIR